MTSTYGVCGVRNKDSKQGPVTLLCDLLSTALVKILTALSSFFLLLASCHECTSSFLFPSRADALHPTIVSVFLRFPPGTQLKNVESLRAQLAALQPTQVAITATTPTEPSPPYVLDLSPYGQQQYSCPPWNPPAVLDCAQGWQRNMRITVGNAAWDLESRASPPADPYLAHFRPAQSTLPLQPCTAGKAHYRHAGGVLSNGPLGWQLPTQTLRSMQSMQPMQPMQSPQSPQDAQAMQPPQPSQLPRLEVSEAVVCLADSCVRFGAGCLRRLCEAALGGGLGKDLDWEEGQERPAQHGGSLSAGGRVPAPACEGLTMGYPSMLSEPGYHPAAGELQWGLPAAQRAALGTATPPVPCNFGSPIHVRAEAARK